MALSIVSDDKFSYVNGVYDGQNNRQFLGIKGMSKKIALPTGKIVIGFDTRVSPAQVRLFYDKGDSLLPGSQPPKFYGLVMTREICFDGAPILPSVFSEKIAYRDKYSAFGILQAQRLVRPTIGTFTVDMLSADKLVNSNPFYAYNSLDLNQAFTIQNPTGFLANQVPAQNASAPLCAALFAPIGIDVEAPYLSDIHQLLTSGSDAIAQAQLAEGDVNNGLLLSKALTALQTDPLKVLKVKVYDNSLLILFSDPENYFPIVYVDSATGNIFSVETNAYQDYNFRATAGLFERFIDYANFYGIASDRYPQRLKYNLRSFGKKQEDLLNMLLSGQEHHRITEVCKVYCVGQGEVSLPDGGTETSYNCIGGVEWKTARWFDKGTLSFGRVYVSEPVQMPLQGVINYGNELYNIYKSTKGYDNVLGRSVPELISYLTEQNRNPFLKTPGTPDQTQWINPSAPLSTTYPPDVDISSITFSNL